jgi:hypothetical protein
MATINALTSAQRYGNTGVAIAPFTDVKNIIGAIIAPKGYEFDITTPQATLLSACLNANPLLRLFPIFDFEATTDNSETRTVQTMATGAKHTVREGYNDHKFQFVQGGKDLQAQLRKFNGSNWDFYYIDGGELGIIGTQKLIGIQGSSATKLKAIPTDGGEIWTDTFKLNDATKIAEYMIGFVFKQTYLNDLMAFVQLSFDAPTTLYGLADIYLTGVGSATPGTYNITAKTKVGTNLGDVFATQLAAPSNFTATNTSSGATIPITGVTYDATNKLFALVLTTTAPPYPVSGAITFNLVSPSVLDAAGVKGCESIAPVSVIKN